MWMDYQARADSELIDAVRTGNVDGIAASIGKGANIHITLEGDSLLHIAVSHEKENVVRFLLELNLINVDVKNRLDNTPLHYAAINGFEGIVKLLLQHNANPFEKNHHNKTPADVADASVIQLILDKQSQIRRVESAAGPNIKDIAPEKARGIHASAKTSSPIPRAR